jgi:hypothetical protein
MATQEDIDLTKIDVACKEVQDILTTVSNVPALIYEVMKAVERNVKTNKKQAALSIIEKLQITDINLKIAVVGMVQAGLINHLIDSFVVVAKNATVLQTQVIEAVKEKVDDVAAVVEALTDVVEAVQEVVTVDSKEADSKEADSKDVTIKKPKGCCVVM